MASTKNTNTNHSTTLVLGLVTGIRLTVKQQLQITARHWCSVYSRKPIVIPVRPLFVSSPLAFFRACVSVRQSIHPSTHPSICYSFICLSIHAFTDLLVRASVYLLLHPSLHPSIYLSIHTSIYLCVLYRSCALCGKVYTPFMRHPTVLGHTK